MDSDTELMVMAMTDGRPKSFFDHLKERAQELAPDYPFTKEDAFEWLWAITSSLEGTDLAVDYWYVKWLKTVRLLKVLSSAADHTLGNWTNQKVRDRLREVLTKAEHELKMIPTTVQTKADATTEA